MDFLNDKGGFTGSATFHAMHLRQAGARLLFFILVVFLSIADPCTVSAEAPQGRVGMVKNVSGEGYVVRDGRRLPATVGFQLLRGDRLLTGSNGTMGVLLEDDTALSLGPSTESTIEHFAYDPARGSLGMVVRVARGVFGYLSGKIAKLAPGSVRVETPVATLGVRGTYFVARIEP
ncbi:FecR domain-containing protein [Geomonas sp. RF6]|uniref:FecR family protein n=1 Tax=Geomonas sp. RF6 TaxID=2897342 RepID=UPI001E30FB6E|nr:FecR domain-containing protein [Geomonas sp. RF6]UFS70493.1 FecR domain-containing protein [Geomonas sp. RF6]